MAQTESAKIGVATATITGMNAMIGSGIFTAPAILALNIGPAGILAYIFVVFAVWFIAQSLARVASLFPEEGSFYTYAKQWGGHTVGLLSAGSYIIGLTIAMGLLSHLAGHFLLPFFPNANPNLLGFLILVTLVGLNMFGVVMSQLGQRILICCTVFPLLATIVMCLTKVDTSLLTPFAPSGFTNVFKATSLVIFSFFGFESAASLFNIVKNPQKNVPRALTYAIILVGALYILFIGAILLAVPLNLFSSAKTPIAETLRLVFPGAPWLIKIIHVSILSAVLGTIHSMIWGSSNLLFSLVKKMQSPIAKQLVKMQLITTKSSVLLIGLGIFTGFATIKNIGLFMYLTAVFIIFSLITAIVTLLTIKKEWRSGQNIKTLLGIGTALMMLVFAVQGIMEQVTKLTH